MKIDFTIGFYMELSLGGALEVKKKATQQFSPELATSWTGLKIIDLNQFVDYKSNFVVNSGCAFKVVLKRKESGYIFFCVLDPSYPQIF